MKFRTPSFLEKLVTWFMVAFLATPTSVIYAQLQPPVVIRHEVNNGSPQRSSVTNLAYYFNTNVVIGVRDLVLRDLSTNGPIDATNFALAYDALSNKASFTFPGLPGRSLPQGNFMASLLANTITNAAGLRLDGNNDDQPGGAYSFGTFRYFGDWNGDRDIDFWDNYWFQRSFGKVATDTNYDAQFDVNADGVVDATDRAQFSTNYFTILPPQPGIFAALVNDTGLSHWDNVTSDATISGTVIRTNPATSFHALLSPATNLLDATSTLATNGNFLFTSNVLSQLLGEALTNGGYLLHLETREMGGLVSATYDLPFTLESPCAFADSNLWVATAAQPATISSQSGLPGSVVFTNCEVVMTEGDSFQVTLERTFTVPANAGLLAITYATPTFDDSATNRMRDAFEAALVDATGRPLTFTIQGAAGLTPAGNSAPQVLPASPDAFFNHSDGKSPFVAPGAVIVPSTLNPQHSALLVDVSSFAGATAKLILRLANNDADASTTVRITDVSFKAADSSLNLAGSPPTALSVIVGMSNGGQSGVSAQTPCASTGLDFQSSPKSTPKVVQGNAATSNQVAIAGFSSGTFVNPRGPAGMVVTGVGTTNFTWGLGSGTPSSSLRYGGANFAASAEEFFSIGTLNYYNGTISGGTGADSVDLRITVVFLDDTGFPHVFDYPFTLVNSPNTSDPVASADFVVLSNSLPAQTFFLDGREHTVQLFFGQTSSNGFSTVDRFHVLENATASADLVGRFTANFVGLPGTPTVGIVSPLDANRSSVGSAILTGFAHADRPELLPGTFQTNRITLVTVNGQPVDALDAAGNFFSNIEIKPGQNVFNVVATDAFSQSTTNTVTIFGTTCPQNFSSLGEVSSSVTPEYGRTTLNEWTKTLYADVALRNTGTYPMSAPFFVGVTRISDPSVQLLSPDGVSADGVPYYDFSAAITNKLAPGETSGYRTLAFYNPNHVQFTYDLVVLGQLNQAPHFTSTPQLEAIADRTYSYDANAADPDSDVLSYSLLTAPTGMTIQVASGLTSWTPTTNQLGTHDIVIRTVDGNGGIAEQHYLLNVITEPSNRPPYFVSTPVSIVRLGTNYFYAADAIDPDFDTLTYSLLVSPSNMTINPVTGLITLGPTVAQIGDHDVTIQVSDGRGGTSFQSYRVCVLAPENNRPPMIVSYPVTNIHAGQDFGYQTAALDPDEDEITYSLVAAPQGMTIDPHSGVINWTAPQPTYTNVFFADFSAQVPGEFSGVTNTEPVQGYANLGSGTNRFSGLFLRNDRSVIAGENRASSTRLTLSNLPPHTSVRLGFLLAIIDSWDGNSGSFPAPDLFNVAVDGSVLFSQTFENAFGQLSQGYLPPPGVQLAGNADLGFSPGLGFYRDAAYDMGLDPQFQAIPHSRSELVIEWYAGGGGWQAGGDESWAIDNVAVALGNPPPVTSSNVIAGPIVNPANGHAYFLLAPSKWTEAEAEAVKLGGHLATIRNQSENDWIYANFSQFGGTNRALWIGLNDAASEGVFNWVSGEVSPFINWGNGEPANQNGLDDYVHLFWPGDWRASTWNDNWDEGLGGVPGYYLGIPLNGVVEVTHQSLPVTVRVEDGRGGFDVQSFIVSIQYPGTGTIQGMLFNDFDRDGTPDGLPSEPPLSHWTVYQDQNSNGLFDVGELTTTTDTNGSYAFTGLPVGSFNIGLVTMPGWVQNTPASRFHQVALTNNQSVSNLNFGAHQPDNSLDNTSPVFVTAVPSTSLLASHPFVYRTLAFDADGDLLNYDLINQPEGMMVETNTGIVAWQPGLDQLGVHEVILRVQDDRGGVALQSWQITVVAPNSAPVITSFPPGPVVVGLPYRYAIRAQDAEGQPLTFLLASNLPSGIVLDSTFSTPTSALLSWTPALAHIGTNSIEIIVRDSEGAEARQVFNLEVVSSAPNTAPYFTSTPRKQTRVGLPYAYRVGAGDSDGDPLAFQLVSSPAGMAFTNDQPSTFNSQLLVWTPTDSQFGSNFVAIQISDGRGGTNLQQFAITVSSTLSNQAPLITSAPQVHATAEQPYEYDLQAEDSDGDELNWRLVSGPVGMSIDPQTGALRWNPTHDQLGTNTVIVQVQDTFLATDMQAFQIDVGCENRPPQIASTPPVSAQTSELYLYAARGSDPDDDSIAWSLTTRPTGMTMDATTGLIRWNPATNQVGPNTVTLRASDGRGGIGSQTYTLYVGNQKANHAPVITSAPAFGATVDRPYAYALRATDSDGDTLTLQILSAPTGTTLTPTASTAGVGQGLINWTPTSAQAGPREFIISARDTAGASASQRFTVTVRSNDAPVITSTPLTSGVLAVTYRYDVRASDPNSDTLSYALTQAPSGMTIDSLGRIAWMPTFAQVGTNAVTVAVSDGFGGLANQSYSVVVGADTQSPTVELAVNYNLQDSSGNKYVRAGTQVGLRVNATDNVGVANRALWLDGVPVALASDGSTTVQFPASGFVQAIAQATDGAGNIAFTTNVIPVVDPNAANTVAVVIHSPTNSAELTKPADVIATITSQVPLRNYILEYAELTSEASGLEVAVSDPSLSYHTITNATLPAGTLGLTNAILGRFDPLMLQNGGYVIRVTAYDLNGQGRQEGNIVNVTGNLKFGEFRIAFTDLSIPVAGIPITIQRVYDTRDSQRKGDFGYGWTLGVQDARILEVGKKPFYGLTSEGTTFSTKTRVYLTTPDGRRVGFNFAPQFASGGLFWVFYRPAFTADPGVYDKLESIPSDAGYQIAADGSFTGGFGLVGYDPTGYRLTTKDGMVYEYDQNFGLQRVTDLNGNALAFTRDGVQHTSAGSTAVDQQINFVRDAQGRITQIIDPNGNALRYTYDTKGDLRLFTDLVSNVTQYAYSAARAHYLTNIIDPFGRPALNLEYDSAGRLKTIRDGNGNPVSQDFNPDLNTGSFTDGNGNVTFVRFDDRGNEVERSLPGIFTNRMEYDANNNLLRGVDGRGFETNFTYDVRGNVTSITDALSNRTSIAYNTLNKPSVVTNALGQVLRLNYDNTGKLLNVLNNAGQQTVVTRDSQGRVASLTDAAGHTTSFDYIGGCSCGKPGKVTNADGSFRLMEYDSFGNTTRLVNELGAETLSFYNSNGQLFWTRDPLTNYTQFFYNGPLLTNIVDALGRSTRYQYDSLNRTNAIIDAQGGVVRFEYDNNGNRTKVIDPLTNITTFVFDAGNRLVQQIDPLGHTNFFAYDAAGNRVEAIDRNGRKRTFSYDSLNRMTNELWWEGTNVVRSIEFAFNKLGVQTMAADPAARYDYTYDLLNRLQAVIQSAVPGQPDFSLAYTYTALGQVASVTDNYGVQVGSAYDTRNRLARRTWQGTGVDPARVDFAYDVTGNRTRSDRYADLAGANLVGSTTNAYNLAGIVTNITHLGAASEVLAKYDYAFDAANQITQWSINNQLSTFDYDRTGQLTNALNTAQPNENFRFDANGNRVGAQPSGSYVVGGNNQILSDGTNRYAYDFEGNMVSRSNTVTGVLTAYQWDHRNRLMNVLDYNSGGVVTQTVAFVYDAMNRRLSKAVNGQVTRFLYNHDDSWADLDGSNAVTARYLHGARIDELLARQRASDGRGWYLTDHLGTVRDIANAAGAAIAHVEYSSFGQVLSVSNPGAVDRFLFTGRELDGESALYFFRTRYYSCVLGRFIAEDTLGFEGRDYGLYRYVGNSPANRIDPTGTISLVQQVAIVSGVLGAVGSSKGYIACAVARGDKIEVEIIVTKAIKGFVVGYALSRLFAKTDISIWGVTWFVSRPFVQGAACAAIPAETVEDAKDSFRDFLSDVLHGIL